ncbi:hypothetical protein CBR_g20191 [Chara braunii]|uniref:Uncharacterized protein n=1 Tax=Chara braunii TaxID=69332 RepID=A0A388KZS0_CHABU|nr:hypothetical protein CBR_g20191 [Chara braunii]|eukprot:GBG75560.1 hypothetical protein CBR_g20191 [Chara braunii]
MSPRTHTRLAEPFPPCAKSVRHFNGVTSIHGATREDFEEDPWMTVVPCMDRHLDGWHDVHWALMESRCPWASQYKFANMLEFGDLITQPEAVLGHKFLNRMRRTLSCIRRHFSRLECHYGKVVADAKGALLDMDLFKGFGAGAANTPFYSDLRRQGGSVLGREFFNLLEEKDVGLDVPCDVGPDQEFSTPLQLCGGSRSLLGSDVAKRYNFKRWSAEMVYFSDHDFEGYFLVSSQDNKKDLKAPPRQLKLSMKDIRWQWKHDGCPRAVMGIPSGKQAQVQDWHQGLDDELWDNSKKHVSDSALFKDCPPYMGCNQDNSIEVTEKLAGHKKLSIDWRNKVLSVLNGSRLKSREIALAEGIVHIKWKDTGDVTSIAPFGNDPLEANVRGAKLKEAVHNLSFLASMHHLSFVKLLEGKWVRRDRQKKSFPVGNNLYAEDDRMYILFKGDDLRVSTSVVYEGKLPYGAAAAVRLPQRVTQTDVSEIPFTPCDWSLVAPERQGSVYGDMKRNPTQFIGLLEFLTKKGEGVVFLGKPHSRSVWDRHVVAMEGNSDLLQFTMQVVKGEVNLGGHNCEFMVVKPTQDRVWSNNTDMWFKLSERERNKIYDFLFLQTWPRTDTYAEYVRRKDHMLALLDNYHFASRMNAKTFLERLQSLYFVESEQQLKFASYSSLISTDDEEAIGVEFVANAKEEESDTESLDLQYDPFPTDHDRGSSSAGPSSSAAALLSPTAKLAPGSTRMKLLERLKPLAIPPPALRPGIPKLAALRRATERCRLSGGDARKDCGERLHVQGPSDTETTKSAEIRTSSGGECRPGNVVPPRGAAIMETEGRSSGFNTGVGEGDEFRGKEVGEEMEEGKKAPEGEEEVEEEEEGEEARETELIELLEGRDVAGAGDDEVEHSEEAAGSGESSDDFGQLYGGHHEDDFDDNATAMEMETQVISSLSAEPEDYALRPLTSAVDLQHRFDEAAFAISPSKASRCISIDKVIDSILGDHHMSAHPSRTQDVDDAGNVTFCVSAALASSPPKSLILPPTLAAGGEGEVRGRQHVTSTKKSRVDTQALDVLALPAPNSPSKDRREKQTCKP